MHMLSDTHVFYPTRILSATTAADLMSWVQRNLEANQKELLINFRDVLFMDSTGLGILVTALQTVKQAEGRLVLCNLTGQARMIFEMTGMESLFEICDRPEDFTLSQ